MTKSAARLGILVGGGPAPGINCVISSVTIEAINSGLEVIGIYEGFKNLIAGNTAEVRPLAISDVSSIHFQGGSILRTSRANPTRHPEDLVKALATIKELGLDYLVTIGGDDTAFGASEIARVAGGTLRVAHVPKTIDNDLPLPGGMPTFGFETARHLGTQLVRNLMEDSRTTNRWYFVVVMGRTAGHLALGIGKAAGATLTLIPEEFNRDNISLDEVSRLLEGAILKRRMMGRERGVAVIAEGIGPKLDPQELAQAPGVTVEYDPYGHIRLSEIPLATILRRGVQRRFAIRDEQIAIVESTIGYELRSASPIPFDIDYTRTLGYGAVGFLLTPPSEEELTNGGMVCLDHGRLHAMPFSSLRDAETGRTKIRTVDIRSEHYVSARQYMIRLESRDLNNPDTLAKLAETANMSPSDFSHAFSPVMGLTNEGAVA
ncbi:MAG: diphosphate--fructose-6-phosphate 1-phosphotransferase [Chloroflexi bacterium]|nr:diphosphate--fructose-6-phosphate 1-phosphotransferase [Chloroflexota bacterium]